MSQQQQHHQQQHHQQQQQQRKRVTNMMDWDSLNEWAKDKPLSILQLDPADRAVLKIAGELWLVTFVYQSDCHRTTRRYFVYRWILNN